MSPKFPRWKSALILFFLVYSLVYPDVNQIIAPGWLLYHPVLGVVSKEEADRYDCHKRQIQICSVQATSSSKWQNKEKVAGETDDAQVMNSSMNGRDGGDGTNDLNRVVDGTNCETQHPKDEEGSIRISSIPVAATGK